MAQLRIRRLGYALGAEVSGVDVTRPLDRETIAELRKAWLEHLVLCFPGQKAGAAGLMAFASCFGELDDNPRAVNRSPEESHVTLITNRPVAGKPWNGYKNGQSWHSDRSYRDAPTLGTFISCEQIPAVGGDTLFSNMYAAYDTLSPAMRAVVDGLSAVHDVSMVKGLAQRGAELTAEIVSKSPPVVHPVAKLHPETERKALFVGDRVRSLFGMTEEESRPLLDFLIAHAVRYEFTYRHRWTVGDLVMWDNRCTMHLALSDYDLTRDPRHLIRCSLKGPKSGYEIDAGGAIEARGLVATPS